MGHMNSAGVKGRRIGTLPIFYEGKKNKDSEKKKGKFKSLADFFERINHKNLNKKSVEALAKSGAMDNLVEEPSWKTKYITLLEEHQRLLARLLALQEEK